MKSEREAMATTSLVAVKDTEKGFDGSGTIVGETSAVVPRRCTCNVESHEADTTRECSLL